MRMLSTPGPDTFVQQVFLAPVMQTLAIPLVELRAAFLSAHPADDPGDLRAARLDFPRADGHDVRGIA